MTLRAETAPLAALAVLRCDLARVHVKQRRKMEGAGREAPSANRTRARLQPRLGETASASVSASQPFSESARTTASGWNACSTATRSSSVKPLRISVPRGARHARTARGVAEQGAGEVADDDVSAQRRV